MLLPHLGSTHTTRVRMGMICLENIAAVVAESRRRIRSTPHNTAHAVTLSRQSKTVEGLALVARDGGKRDWSEWMQEFRMRGPVGRLHPQRFNPAGTCRETTEWTDTW